jgi:hypothetical protein
MIKDLEKRKEKTKSCQDHTLTATRGNVFDAHSAEFTKQLLSENVAFTSTAILPTSDIM